MPQTEKLLDKPHPYVVRLRIANLLAAGKVADAEQASAAAAKDFPGARALVRQRAEVLNAAKKWDESIALLRNETRLYKSDAELWRMLGEAYLAVHEVTQRGPQEPGSSQGAPQEHEPHQPADHEGGERSAHGQGRALTPEPAQVGAGVGRGRPRGERHGSAGQTVKVLDPGGLQACEADHEVDEQDEEQQADPEQGNGRRRK